MSETTGSGRGGAGPATDTRTGAAPVRPPGPQTVEEAYSFACMNCGHCWEQAYEIDHHSDTSGRPYVTYRADGVEVPSPLTRPTCDNCDGHHVRIMRSGQVSAAVANRWTLDHPAERGVHRTRHWPALHFLRRKPQEPGPA
jgi:hypothetical protein